MMCGKHKNTSQFNEIHLDFIKEFYLNQSNHCINSKDFKKIFKKHFNLPNFPDKTMQILLKKSGLTHKRLINIFESKNCE